MLRKLFIYIFAVSLITMLSSSYILVNHLQSAMREEVSQSHERIARLKQTVKVHDYLMRLNSNERAPVEISKQLDELNQLLADENRVLNRNEHRNLRTEVAEQLNLQQVPDKALINSWLASSMLNEMIELEKQFQPSSRNTAPIEVMSDSQWSSLFGILWLSMVVAAFSGGSVMGNLLTKKQRHISNHY